MFSMIVLICYEIDRFISEYRVKQTKKEQRKARDYGKGEPSWNQSFV